MLKGDKVYSKSTFAYNPSEGKNFTVYKNSKGTILQCIQGFKNDYYEVNFKNGIAIMKGSNLKSTL